MARKPVLIGLDRDGNVVRDENFYLGKSDNWREQLELLPTVPEGIRTLNQIPNSVVAIISNQSGVALADPEFANLTVVRVVEVHSALNDMLLKQGCRIDGYFFCPYVDNEYVKKANEKGRSVNPHYVKDGYRELKPNIGLLERAAESKGHKLQDYEVYVIGDRLTDVETGLNANGVGVLVAGYKTRELGDIEKTLKLKQSNPDRVYLADTFSLAADIVAELAGERS